MLDITNDLMLMSEYNLTAEELLFIELFFYYKEGEVENMRIFLSQIKLTPSQDLLRSLMEKRVLLKDDVTEKRKLSDYEFNKNFLNKYNQYSTEMGEELFFTYPAELQGGNGYFKAKNISKRFDSLDDFSYFYGKQIKFKKENHERVMDILKWAIDNDRLFYGIVEFVVSHKWIELEEERKNGFSGYINTIEML